MLLLLVVVGAPLLLLAAGCLLELRAGRRRWRTPQHGSDAEAAVRAARATAAALTAVVLLDLGGAGDGG